MKDNVWKEFLEKTEKNQEWEKLLEKTLKKSEVGEDLDKAYKKIIETSLSGRDYVDELFRLAY